MERYAIESLPKDAVVDGNIANLEAVAEAVERGWKKMATRTKNVAMALPSAAVITKKIIVPAGLREEELELQVESEANQYIPFALEEVNLDFQVVGPAPSCPEEVEVLIAASRKEKVEDRVAVAEAAGLNALVMDVESYAMQAAFDLIKKQFPDEGKDQNIALVDVGANVMNITVLRNDQPVYTREQAFGGNQLTQDIMRQYGMSQEEAEAAKRSGGLPENYEAEVLRPFMENAGARSPACDAVLLHLDAIQQHRPHPADGRLGGDPRPGRGRRRAHPGQHVDRQPVCEHGVSTRGSS